MGVKPVIDLSFDYLNDFLNDDLSVCNTQKFKKEK